MALPCLWAGGVNNLSVGGMPPLRRPIYNRPPVDNRPHNCEKTNPPPADPVPDVLRNELRSLLSILADELKLLTTHELTTILQPPTRAGAGSEEANRPPGR